MVHVCIFLPWVANGWVSMDDCNGVFLGYSRKVFSFLMPLPPPHSNHMCVVSLRVLFCGTNANVDLHFLLRFWHVCYIHKNTTPIIHKLQLWVTYECQRRRQYENLGSCHESIWNIKGDDQGPTVTWSMSFVHDIHPMCFMIKKMHKHTILVVNWRFRVAVFGQWATKTSGCQPKWFILCIFLRWIAMLEPRQMVAIEFFSDTSPPSIFMWIVESKMITRFDHCVVQCVLKTRVFLVSIFTCPHIINNCPPSTSHFCNHEHE